MNSKFEKCRYYLGTAQIRVLNLYYSASSTEPDDCIVCCISDLEHNLPALIDPSTYHDYLTSAGISSDALYAIGLSPKLSLPSTIELPCLHGKFRLETAKRDGPQGQEDWWLVDLYSSGESTIFVSKFGC